MKLSATTTNVSIPAQPHKAILHTDNMAGAAGKTIWRSLVTGFWAYTEETSKTETKSYEGLL